MSELSESDSHQSMPKLVVKNRSAGPDRAADPRPFTLPAENTFLNRVVVGEVTAIRTILQSSGLKDVTVDCGDRCYRTVSTADEIQVGMKTAFALLGARLTNDYVQIEEINGVESHGRLCTHEDLGLRTQSGSIIKLPPHLKNGLRLEDLIP